MCNLQYQVYFFISFFLLYAFNDDKAKLLKKKNKKKTVKCHLLPFSSSNSVKFVFLFCDNISNKFYLNQHKAQS